MALNRECPECRNKNAERRRPWYVMPISVLMGVFGITVVIAECYLGLPLFPLELLSFLIALGVWDDKTWR